VLTRNEHCPPHAHVGAADWDARFEFSFWHNSVRLWDVLPAQNAPTAQLLEELRQALKQRAHLKRARQLWWASRQTLCLDHQQWDTATEVVVSPRLKRPGALDMQGTLIQQETGPFCSWPVRIGHWRYSYERRCREKPI
jgi:hypothetical protein